MDYDRLKTIEELREDQLSITMANPPAWFVKFSREFILGQGYVTQQPLVITQDEFLRQTEGGVYQNVHYEPIDGDTIDLQCVNSHCAEWLGIYHFDCKDVFMASGFINCDLCGKPMTPVINANRLTPCRKETE